MSSERDIVVTAYGHNHIIDKLAISTFGDDSGYRHESDNANTYCDMINSLELKEGSWVFARIVPENTPFDLNRVFPFNFQEVILKLDNRSLQKMLMEIDFQVLAIALFDATDELKEKIFSNMSRRASKMFKEDMESLKRLGFYSIREHQDKVLKLVRTLADTGEIVIQE